MGALSGGKDCDPQTLGQQAPTHTPQHQLRVSQRCPVSKPLCSFGQFPPFSGPWAPYLDIRGWTGWWLQPLPAGPSFQPPTMCGLRATRQGRAVSRHFLLLHPAPCGPVPLLVFSSCFCLDTGLVWLCFSTFRRKLSLPGAHWCTGRLAASRFWASASRRHRTAGGKEGTFLSQSWAADRQQGRAGAGSVPRVIRLWPSPP